MKENLFAPGGFWWWQGVVEDRQDPLLLGRCRVRIFGYHTEDKTQLPTEDLPWAYPIQPITSAAMNGIGQTPLGPVEGTWVFGFFRDGEDCQEPVIFGTSGGVPQPNSIIVPQTGQASDGVVTDVDKNPLFHSVSNEPLKLTETPKPAFKGVIGNLTKDDTENLFAALRERESTNNYQAISVLGYIGAYQFGALLLQELGYLKAGSTALFQKEDVDESGETEDFALQCVENNLISSSFYSTIPEQSRTNINFFALSKPELWSSRSGGSPSNFLNSEKAQDQAVKDAFVHNHKELVRLSVITDKTPRPEVGGLLFAAHLSGIGGVLRMRKNVGVSDANGVTALEYYNLGYRVIQPGALEQTNKPSPSNISKPPAPKQTQLVSLATIKPRELGFVDPNKEYPRSLHIGEPDTNRLARHQKVSETIVKQKDDLRLRDVETAINGPKWSQPRVPYNSKYPFNHVIESESGHIFEVDDTEGNERLHRYHRTGTFEEIDRNGTLVRRIVGDNFEIIERNGNLFIAGRMNVTIGGKCNIFVQHDCNLEVNGNMRAHVHRDFELNVGGRIRMVAGERIDIQAGNNLNLESKRNVNIKGSSSIKLRSSKIAVSATSTLGLEGKTKLNIKTLSAKVRAASFTCVTPPTSGIVIITPGSGAQGASVRSPIDKRSPKETTFPELIVPDRAEETAFVLDALSENPQENAGAIEAVKQEAIQEGLLNETELKQEPNVIEKDESSDKEKPQPDTTNVCGDIYSFTEFSPSFVLTDHFSLGNLSETAVVSKFAVVSQHGFSKQDIVCNLRALAKNVLEPIYEKYPNLFVTSGFRLPGHSTAKGISQHEIGEAADIQFQGVSKSEYYFIAKWIRQHVPYDQLLLEYKSFGTGMPWIHISFKKEGCRNTCSTFFNHVTAPNGKGNLLQLA